VLALKKLFLLKKWQIGEYLIFDTLKHKIKKQDFDTPTAAL
jgi:hypothetical protein